MVYKYTNAKENTNGKNMLDIHFLFPSIMSLLLCILTHYMSDLPSVIHLENFSCNL
jgi:hypothetical protein